VDGSERQSGKIVEQHLEIERRRAAFAFIKYIVVTF
jgi:hypothetical protein